MLTIATLEEKKQAIIKKINAQGKELTKIESMGIRINKTITKISGQPFKGPQIIKIDNMQVAIGFTIASNILVEVSK